MAPKPFQIEGAAFLAARKRALLADEPGVGKTLQLIRAAEAVGAESVRVICPGVGIEHWRREFKRWWGQPVLPRLEILSFDDARRGHRAGLQGTLRRVDVTIPDECHYAKNPAAQRSLAIFGKGGYGWYTDYLWCASGTPAPNNASELWPLLRAYGATGLDYEAFKNYFCIVDMMGKVRGTREERREELRAILKPFTLRRLKRDVLPELGEIDVQKWYVKPDTRFMVEMNMAEVMAQEHELRVMDPADLLIAIGGSKEFSSLRRYNALLKAPAVYDQIMFEIENGLLDKVVVFGYHKEALAALHNAFNAAGIGAILIYGDTPKGERDALIEGWKRPDGPRVNLSSIVVAGTVLDYTAAHQVIALEMDWVPGNNWQAWQRPHRHGQENPVTVRVAMGTEVDEAVNDVVVRKTKDIAGILD